MKISTLAEYGIPQALIDTWMKKQGECLLPLQERAVKEYDLLDGGSLIVSAPTSSGKTFCGELAAARVLAQRRKVMFLAPLKALAEERYGEFREKYEPLGIRTVISTRDHHDYDQKIEKGEFDLCIMIYEKFNQMLLRNLDLLELIDLLVIDELQMLSDRSRGAVLEMILLKVLSSTYKCRIIGLSAVLSNASELAEWIGARLLIESHRPVELRQGVLHNDIFSFRCFNSGERGTEEMAPLQDASSTEILLENVTRLVNDGEQVLVFLKSKNSCVQLATLLAERSSFSSCEPAVDELTSGEMTVLCEPLINTVGNGIAFHHADLAYRERKIVERYYLAGDIRVIFATTTLSLGLNLPAQTVFLETYKYRQGAYTGRPVAEALSWGDYENMCGRAGRLKFPSAFGRSIIIAENELGSEMLWKMYIRGRPGKLVGHLFSRYFSDLILDFVVSRCAADRDSLLSIFHNAFSDVPDGADAQIEMACSWLCENEFVFESDGRLMPTAFGQQLARLGISVSTGVNLQKLFDSVADYSALIWLYELCDSSEGRRIYVPNSLRDDVGQYLFARFRSLAQNDNPVSKRLADIFDNPHRIAKQIFARVRLVLALYDWVCGRDLSEIEKEYHIYSGTIQSAGETISWLAESAFCLMGTLGVNHRRRLCLKKLSFEVRYGLPVAMRKLYSEVKGYLSRKDMLLLFDNGITTVRSFLSSDREFLVSLLGNPKTEEIMKNLMQKSLSDSGTGIAIKRRDRYGEVKLQLSGAMLRDRFRVMFCSRPLLLTAKSFRYLFKLAAQRKLDNEGWIDKEKLEPGFNQARYLYNLKKELGSPHIDQRELIENDRRGAYRLALSPDEIEFDLPALSRLDDFEIADLSKHLMML